MESALLECKQCKWQGRPDEVNWESVETCMGTDQIEVCPRCGSMVVYPLLKQYETGYLFLFRDNRF